MVLPSLFEFERERLGRRDTEKVGERERNGTNRLEKSERESMRDKISEKERVRFWIYSSDIEGIKFVLVI